MMTDNKCFKCGIEKFYPDICKECKHPFCGLHIDISDDICDDCHDRLDNTFHISSMEDNGIVTTRFYNKNE